MNVDYISAEIRTLNAILDKAQKDIACAPEGNLRISDISKKPKFYIKEPKSNNNGKYIKAEEVELAEKLAQKTYAETIKKMIEKRIEYLSKVQKDYADNNLCSVYDNYNDVRKRLVEPYSISDEEFALNWMNMNSDLKPVEEHPEHLLFSTANGEKVRSKSEVIIADFLKRIGVPYKYEKPLFYSKKEFFCPDFTVLNVKRRKVFYIEHFGRMDFDDYRDSFFWKLGVFNKLGIRQCDNLVMLFEDSKHPFNIGEHEKWLTRLLKE